MQDQIKHYMNIAFMLCFILAYSYLILIPSVLIGNNTLVKEGKTYGMNMTTLLLKEGFGTNFYLHESVEDIRKKMNENPDNIDVLYCNHFSTIDFGFIMAYLQEFNIEEYVMVLRKGVAQFPGLGPFMYHNNDIKLDRNWETDQDNLKVQIKKCIATNTGKKQVIVIFPEGTRFTPEKLVDAQEYSRKSNFPVYENVLVPKTKGLWCIINELKKANRLGRVWDMSVVLPKFIKKTAFTKDIIGNTFGDIYAHIRIMTIPENYEDMNVFRNWMLENWKYRDDYIETNYKNMSFNKLAFEDMRYLNLAKIAGLCTIFCLMFTNKYTFSLLILSIILSYLFILLK